MLQGRTSLVKKTEVIPIECVVRGYLTGSGWKDYQQTGSICGIRLPSGLVESDFLEEPIFTPTTKAESGHDLAVLVRASSPRRSVLPWPKNYDAEAWIFSDEAPPYAKERGILIADTKFEWGRIGDQMILIDEVFYARQFPGSGPADQYQPGRGQPSFDKQFVRDWLEQAAWDKNSPPPALPEDVVVKTRQKYVEAYERLTGKTL